MRSLVFWYARNDLSALIATDPIVSPSRAVVHVMLVEFEHLHTKEKPVGSAGGFNLAPYDDATVECECMFLTCIW